MRVSRSLLVLMALVLVAVLSASSYLFRRKTIDSPDLGRVTLNWRWGKATEIAVDSNIDGQIDFRLLYRRSATDFHTHEAYDEAWESSKCDGRFDRHMLAADGRLQELSYDTDGDGTLDGTLMAADAEQYLWDNPRAPDCGWGPELRTPSVVESM